MKPSKQNVLILALIVLTVGFQIAAYATPVNPLRSITECKALLKSEFVASKSSDDSEVNIYTKSVSGFGAKERIETILAKDAQILPTQDSIATRELKKAPARPSGELKPTTLKSSRGSQGGSFYRDSNGEVYYLKRDIKHPELQTSADVVAAWTYRHFEFLAPETYIVNVDGIRYSASRLLPDGRDTTLVSDMPNTTRFRMLRIVAAFLKDWDRLRVGPNNRIFADGSIGLYDFGGTLGALAQGEFKPGVKVFSDAIGTFQAPEPFEVYGKQSHMGGDQWRGEHPMKELFESFRVDWLPMNHPWRLLTVEDAKIAREYFRTLDRQKISEIVEKASYSSGRDRIQMINSLYVRRNAFLEYLVHYLENQQPVERKSYWAQFIPESKLTFEVDEKRSPQIGQDIAKFLKRYVAPTGHMILFRGQEALTQKVLSPMARENEKHGVSLLTGSEIEKTFQRFLMSQKMNLNWERTEAHKYDILGGDSSGETSWWDRATPLDGLIGYHSKSSGHPFLVSATRDVGIASLWIEEGRWQPKYRYVYILSVPEEQTVPVTRSLLTKHGTNRESEVAVLYDATPYVIAIYDTIDLKFVNLEGVLK